MVKAKRPKAADEPQAGTNISHCNFSTTFPPVTADTRMAIEAIARAAEEHGRALTRLADVLSGNRYQNVSGLHIGETK
jgi:hypothetical protein